jgi:hypothetical protein
VFVSSVFLSVSVVPMLYPVMLILLAMVWRRVCGEVSVDVHLPVCLGWCF